MQEGERQRKGRRQEAGGRRKAYVGKRGNGDAEKRTERERG
jgi:hypothetical protein